MSPVSKLYTLFIFLTLISQSSPILSSKNSNKGFSFPIVHRDSPESPLYEPNATIRWQLAHQRSTKCRAFLLSSDDRQDDNLITTLSAKNRDLLVKISIGTPPFDTMAVLDTGSDTSWFQCIQCTKCYEQNTPKFDPYKSKTLKWVDCDTEECRSLEISGCTADHKCGYALSYVDESESFGKLVSDTIYFNSTNSTTAVFDEILFGCSKESSGLFPLNGGGLVGLDGGYLSLISQLGVSRRFSHCFKAVRGVEGAGTGRLYLGRIAPFVGAISPLNIVTSQNHNGLLYFVTLEGISVGSERLQIPEGTFARKSDGSGGVIIDSGTTYTYLYNSALSLLTKKLEEVIKLKKVEYGETILCYEGNYKDLMDLKVPYITFHFTKLDVRFHPLATFEEYNGNSICLAMVDIEAEEGMISIIGYYIQQNMNVGFDLDLRVFTMAPADCDKIQV